MLGTVSGRQIRGYALLVIVFATAFAASARAQSVTGAIQGTVVDQSGGAAAGRHGHGHQHRDTGRCASDA